MNQNKKQAIIFWQLRWLWLLCALFLVLPNKGYAYTGVTVVVSELSPANQSFISELGTLLAATPQSRLRLSTKTISTRSKLEVAENSELVVALGAQAFEAAAKLSPTTPVLGLHISQATFDSIQRKSRRHQANISAITLHQPNQRVLDLLKYSLPKAKRAGILIGFNAYSEGEAFKASARKMGVEVELADVNFSVDLIAELSDVLSKTDVLIAYPDNEIFNRETASAIMLHCYQNRKPVIGYSQSSVSAGAYAAVYSDVRHLAKQVAEIAEHSKIANTYLPLPQPPKYFSVQVNKQVARYLNIKMMDEAWLYQKVLERETMKIQ